MSSPTHSRRRFLKYAAGAAGIALVAGMATELETDESPILVNHVGFAARAFKTCHLAAARATPFRVVDATTGSPALTGIMRPAAADLGQYVQGDFTALQAPGTYFLEAAGRRSAVFLISATPYDSALQMSVEYFAKQRCGNTTTGYHSPCHVDDGRRLDNHKHQEVSGGWHDACDLRKWVDATIYGMCGLAHVLDLMPAGFDGDRIMAELRWGNQYFRKMQEPAGYVMDYCGGDDGNYFTDNVVGSSDDRPIHTDPVTLPAQFEFIAAQAFLARQLQSSDPDYAHSALEAADRCLNWATTSRNAAAATSLAAAVSAFVQLDRAKSDPKFAELTADYLKRLIALQVQPAASPSVWGFFLTAPGNNQPSREIQHGNLPLLALCDALERFPTHPDAVDWHHALVRHAEYLTAVSALSTFSAVPFGLYTSADPGGNRRLGPYWYRYSMKVRNEYADSPDWWVGINAHLASHGVGLSRASRILKDPKLAQLAQRQLDWILGANPFNASTVIGVGNNQPRLYSPGAFTPVTPVINGGVMNGIGGNSVDHLVLTPGDWHTCEYWTPMVAYTMWLMAELDAASRGA